MLFNNSTCNIEKIASEMILKPVQNFTPKELFNSYYKHIELVGKEGIEFKIPPISHHIWLTNPKSSKEVRLEDMENLKKSISIIDNHSTTSWQHIFWTNCKACIPETIHSLADINIQIKEISEIESSLISYNLVNDLIDKKTYGMAADIIREDIVNLQGGLYLDLNYEIYKSPENLMKQFNFFVDAPEGINVENYMFASSPNHPILNEALLSAIQYVKYPEAIFGESIAGCNILDITNYLTFGPFANAFINNANKHNTTDLAIPPRDDKGIFNDSGEEDEEDTNISPFFTNGHFAEYINYFDDNLQCIDANFGSDGTNGLTWNMEV